MGLTCAGSLAPAASRTCVASQRDWYFIAKQSASAPHMLRIVPHTVPRVGRSYQHFPDGFELHLLTEGLRCGASLFCLWIGGHTLEHDPVGSIGARPSKANLLHAIDLRDLCGAVTSKLPSDDQVNDTLELHRVEGDRPET